MATLTRSSRRQLRGRAAERAHRRMVLAIETSLVDQAHLLRQEPSLASACFLAGAIGLHAPAWLLDSALHATIAWALGEVGDVARQLAVRPRSGAGPRWVSRKRSSLRDGIAPGPWQSRSPDS